MSMNVLDGVDDSGRLCHLTPHVSSGGSGPTSGVAAPDWRSDVTLLSWFDGDGGNGWSYPRDLERCTTEDISRPCDWEHFDHRAVPSARRSAGTSMGGWTGSEQLLDKGSPVSITFPVVSNRPALLTLPWFTPPACGRGSFRVQCPPVRLSPWCPQGYATVSSLRTGSRRRHSVDPTP